MEDGTGVSQDQSAVHTDDLSRRRGCRQGEARVSGGKGGGVHDSEETGVEWMRRGFCLGVWGVRRERAM